jgi:hypothetical protein
MRKLVVVIVLVVAFAVGVGVGITPQAQAGKTKCWTECSGGTLLECCRIGPIVNCRVLVDDC